MLTGIVRPTWDRSHSASESFGKQELTTEGTGAKFENVGGVLRDVMPHHAKRVLRRQSFSPLRLLWWVSLLFSAQAQRTDPFPAQFELSSLVGTNGFVINGEQRSDQSGISGSSAGDVNGDGIQDLIIGANHASPSGRLGAGKTYVVFGGKDIALSGALELSSLNGTNGFVINGEVSGDSSGYSVSDAGDVNGDGTVDLLIGARMASPSGRTNAGRSYVIFGSNDIGRSGILELASLNGTTGFILNGENANDTSGNSVSSAGDVNGDGISDILIGANRATASGRGGAGKTYVIFGGKNLERRGVLELSNLNGTDGFVLNGEAAGDYSGNSVSCAGDVNDDDIVDLLIGAYNASSSGSGPAGKTYVLFGGIGLGRGGTIELSSLNGTNGFIINGEQAGDWSGFSVSNAGDVNSDGIDDLLVGAGRASPFGRFEAGSSYVIFGNGDLGSSGILELSSLNGTNGYVINGEQAGAYYGRSVSYAGDLNGDGIADLLMGASNSSPPNREFAGKSFIVFGGSGLGSNGVLELSRLQGQNGFELFGANPSDRSGNPVSSVGDVNGDGTDDFLIGAYTASPSGRFRAGKVFIVFGRNVRAPQTQSLSTSNIMHTTSATMEKHKSWTPTTWGGTQQIDIISGSSTDKMKTRRERLGDGAVAGIAGAVAALFVSFGVVAWCKLSKRNDDPEDHPEKVMKQIGVVDAQTNNVVGEYGIIPPPRQDVWGYTKPPAPEQGELSEYDRLNGQQLPNEYDVVGPLLENPNYESVTSKLVK